MTNDPPPMVSYTNYPQHAIWSSDLGANLGHHNLIWMEKDEEGLCIHGFHDGQK